ncbi:hypothetical protein [Alkalihalobacillus deserti]|uniref:hypothetical protein n=1 Tax=Alkalihalobacillus deserti TaxID=2879466 RepID=UPI001D144F6B|nr:hypothetical protein [Alkalihalobacillus deserti]
MKRLVTFLIAIFIIISVSIFFFVSNIDKTVTAENQVKKENRQLLEKSSETINNHDGYLELIKRPFAPDLIGFLTGKPMKFEKYTLADVSDGVYVSGVQGHSGKQAFTIYSKDKTSETKIIKVKVEGKTLKVFLEEDKSKTLSEEHLVYQTQTSNIPNKYEVIRSSQLEKSEKIFYGYE